MNEETQRIASVMLNLCKMLGVKFDPTPNGMAAIALIGHLAVEKGWQASLDDVAKLGAKIDALAEPEPETEPAPESPGSFNVFCPGCATPIMLCDSDWVAGDNYQTTCGECGCTFEATIHENMPISTRVLER